MNLEIKQTIWKYYAYSFFISLHFFAAILVPFFTQGAGMSLAQVQFVQSWFMFWIFLMEVPTGVVADYVGRKHSIALGSLFMIIGVIVYGSIMRFEIFLLGEMLLAIGFALTSGADSALVYDSLKEAGQEDKSKEVFGRARAMNMAGLLVAPPIGSFIAAQLGYQWTMILTAIPMLIATYFIWSIREPVIHEGPSESKRYGEILRKGLAFLRGHKNLRLLAIDSIMVGSAAYFVIWFYQPLLERINVPVVYFGFFHSFLVAVEIAIAASFVQLEKFFGSTKRFIQFTAIITALSFILVAVYPHIITVILFLGLAGGFGLTRGDLIGVYMNKLIPSQQRATVLSSVSMFRRFALVLLNPFVGYMADASIRLALILVSFLPFSVFFFSPVEKEVFEEAKE